MGDSAGSGGDESTSSPTVVLPAWEVTEEVINALGSIEALQHWNQGVLCGTVGGMAGTVAGAPLTHVVVVCVCVCVWGAGVSGKRKKRSHTRGVLLSAGCGRSTPGCDQDQGASLLVAIHRHIFRVATAVEEGRGRGPVPGTASPSLGAGLCCPRKSPPLAIRSVFLEVLPAHSQWKLLFPHGTQGAMNALAFGAESFTRPYAQMYFQTWVASSPYLPCVARVYECDFFFG